MSIVSINMIIDLNNILKEQDIPYQVHLRDACGRQSMWLEVLDEENESFDNIVYEVMNQYFENQKMKLEFSEDKKTFWIAKG